MAILPETSNNNESSVMMPRLAKRGVIAVGVVALLGAFALGFAIADTEEAVVDRNEGGSIQRDVINRNSGKPEDLDFSLFWEVWGRLHEKFVDRDTLDTEELFYGAIQGMVEASGDSYTTFLPPDDSKIFRENVAGEFSGVGMEIGIRDDALTVIAPLKGTPADRAGFKAGDIITKIDGGTTEDLALDAAVQRIRGPKGTPVTLTVFRAEDSGERDITVVRDVIQIPVLEWDFVATEDGQTTNIAHVRLFQFTETASNRFRQAVTELLAGGAEGVILDLRGNPGGFLEVSVDIASWFVDSGEIIAIERFGPDSQRVYRSVGHPSLRDMPVVILVDEGSASASEILAGALRDIRGVAIVGKQSFGKGSVQELQEFDGGSSLKVTVAKWLTPLGTSIQDNGITPDVEVERFSEELEGGEESSDLQLREALRLLGR